MVVVIYLRTSIITQRTRERERRNDTTRGIKVKSSSEMSEVCSEEQQQQQSLGSESSTTTTTTTTTIVPDVTMSDTPASETPLTVSNTNNTSPPERLEFDLGPESDDEAENEQTFVNHQHSCSHIQLLVCICLMYICLM